MVGEVVVDGVLVVAAGDAFAAKENVLLERGIRDAAGEVRFVQGIAAHAVPVDGAIRFLDAFAVAVVGFQRSRLNSASFPTNKRYGYLQARMPECF